MYVERLFAMKPELLAPCNLRTLSAAVQAGADAVYLGGKNFGARFFADNFDLYEMEKAIDYCHLRGVKVYLTSNILVSDSEISDFLSFITDTYNLGIDAFIMQDIGMAMLVRDRLPDANLHASTQMTIHNKEGATFLKDLGFKRVVTARELTREEISDIAAGSGVETEIFVHGALCMSYSGQCLMSSIIGGRSGNRGSCAQPCRLPFKLVCGDKNYQKGYYLSPRDLSLAGNMTDILSSNISSLKIEGRMKGPDYVAAAVSIFRRLIDEERNCTADEYKLLETAFSRDGFTSGLFTGDRERYINSLSGNDDIYKNRNEALLKELNVFTEENANVKKLPVLFEATAVCGKPLKIKASLNDIDITVCGEKVQAAQNKPLDETAIKKQIGKTGDYPFYAKDINVITDGMSFLPLSEINGVRRRCLDMLCDKITEGYKKNEKRKPYTSSTDNRKEKNFNLAVMVANKEQLEIARKSNLKLFVPCELGTAEDEIAVFPDIIHEGKLEKYFSLLQNTKSENIYTGNLAIIKKAKELGKKITVSPALNVFNSESALFWNKFGAEEIVLSQELNIKQIAKLSAKIPLGAIVYGKPVMMKMAVCPVKAAMKKCGGASCKAFLKDRKNEMFAVLCNGMTTFILNSKPIYMADKLFELEKAGISTGIIHFTNETKAECEKIINDYLNLSMPEISFTRGHFYRGVT